MSKRKGNRRHSEFASLSPKDIASIARNLSLPVEVRRRARTEEKARRVRNRQKRQGG